jgi:putative chitinase
MQTVDLCSMMPNCSRSTAASYVEPLLRAMTEFGIDTPERRCAFLAQIAHESGQLCYTREIWGPTPAQQRYEGRVDLGNVMSGDGERYMGRGLIQITGRANYRRCSQGLFSDDRLLAQPELLEEPELAARSAAWFWHAHGLNALADQRAFSTITMRINGSARTNPERLLFYRRAQGCIF